MWYAQWSSPGSGPASLAFPTLVSGVLSEAYNCPLQWRGRTGFQPVSVSPVLEL
jgi:hypothetical protein